MYSWKRRPLITLPRVTFLFTLSSTLLLAACSGGTTHEATPSADSGGGIDIPVDAEARRRYTLTVGLAGAGTVTSSPAGIDCGGDCSENYARGTSVTLAAAPASGYTFAGWSGGCSGTGGCTVALTAASTVTATFTAAAASAPHAYQVSWDPVADARVTGYKLYYSTSPLGSGTPRIVSLGNVTSYRFSPATAGVGTGATVYFAVSAVGSGLESPLSATVSTAIQ